MRAVTAPAHLAQPAARLSDDGSTVLLDRGNWSGSFPLSHLPSQIRFYRGLRDRKGGKYAAFYQPTLDALEALGREIGGAPAAYGEAVPVSVPLTTLRPSRPAGHTAGHGEPQLPLGL